MSELGKLEEPARELQEQAPREHAAAKRTALVLRMVGHSLLAVGDELELGYDPDGCVERIEQLTAILAGHFKGNQRAWPNQRPRRPDGDPVPQLIWDLRLGGARNCLVVQVEEHRQLWIVDYDRWRDERWTVERVHAAAEFPGSGRLAPHTPLLHYLSEYDLDTINRHWAEEP